MYATMLCPARYLSKKLARPIRTKDSGTLPPSWVPGSGVSRLMATGGRIAAGEADKAAFRKQVELALFYDAKLDLAK